MNDRLRFLRVCSAAVFMSALISGSVFAEEKKIYPIDKVSGFIMAPGWEQVLGNCTACHSSKLVISQGADRDTWKSMIRWMQKTQGLWPIAEASENIILDYLADNYPVGEPTRRSNLPAHLLPQ